MSFEHAQEKINQPADTGIEDKRTSNGDKFSAHAGSTYGRKTAALTSTGFATVAVGPAVVVVPHERWAGTIVGSPTLSLS